MDTHAEIKNEMSGCNNGAVMPAVVDLNGVLRGKRIMPSDAPKIIENGLTMPLSIVGVDIWGRDIVGSTQVYTTGDADGHFRVTGRGPLVQSWFDNPTTLLPLMMTDDQGIATGICARGALQKVLTLYDDAGLSPVAATELEFHLVRRENGKAVADGDGRTGKAAAIECIDAMQEREAFFSEVYDVAARWGIDVGAAISESGVGQFEIVLNHGCDIMKVADDTYFFKRIIRGVAERHGLEGTFMAKPFGDDAGNGLHVHFSILDNQGNNIFDDGGDKGAPPLLHALGGLEASMADLMLIFAPHLNSYRRFLDGSFAPTKVAWGYDNRLAALRVPRSVAKARRIEHRVAGADANPYLVLASILGAAFWGIKGQVRASEPVPGNAYEADRPDLPTKWHVAMKRFVDGDWPSRLFDLRLVRMVNASKKQEYETFAARITDFEFDTYVDKA